MTYPIESDFDDMYSEMIVSTHYDDELFCLGGYIVQNYRKSLKSENLGELYIRHICGLGMSKYCQRDPRKSVTQGIGNILSQYVNFGALGGMNFTDEELKITDIPRIADQILSDLHVVKPKVLFIPSRYDLHQDHQIVNQACLIAIRRLHKYPLKVYEMPSPWHSELGQFRYNTLIHLTDEVHEAKKFLCNFYKDAAKIPDFEKYEYLNLIRQEIYGKN